MGHVHVQHFGPELSDDDDDGDDGDGDDGDGDGDHLKSFILILVQT